MQITSHISPSHFLGGRVAVTECPVAFATCKVLRSIKWFVWPCALPWHPLLSRTLDHFQTPGHSVWNTKCAIKHTWSKKNINQCAARQGNANQCFYLPLAIRNIFSIKLTGKSRRPRWNRYTHIFCTDLRGIIMIAILKWVGFWC